MDNKACTLPKILVVEVISNRYADQLYEDLLYFYNKNVRPVRNASSAVQVKFGASLIRIIDVVRIPRYYGNLSNETILLLTKSTTYLLTESQQL
ncbi:unnamed protein product [Gongylonema pulchrum]|uniref:Neur_chan_LBD domain-containing protein n=1 Tax=Gongylonema pulchrum TaxID=637853 RepID=A0A183EM44_9BILA|nr:unnamed protein product [Gongylonema pulchrum]